MARINGGIIGPDNVPSGPLGSASGVWKLSDAFNYQKAGLWPVVTGITYPVANSLRFNSGSTDYLTRTSTTGNRRAFTYSGWFKRSALSGNQMIFSTGVSSNELNFFFNGSPNTLNFYDYPTSLGMNFTTNQLFRDTSAWYHIVLSVDTTQVTDSDRMKLYVNGEQVTSFSSITYASQDTDLQINVSGRPLNVGSYWNNADYYNGYMSDVYLIDGQQLAATDFGETDSVSGNWKAKAYSGGSYGANGFFLQFQNSGALGTDSSGNTNTFTVNNLTSVDQSTDTPTTNFATLNSLIVSGSPAYANGNTQIVTIGDNDSVVSNIGTDTMKFYFEVKLSSTYDGSGGGINVGGLREEQFNASGFNLGTFSGFNNAYTKFYGNGNDGRFKEGGGTVVTGGLTRAQSGNIVMIAIDPANNRVYAGVNGTWLNSSDPVAGIGYIGGTQASGTGNWFGYHSSDLDKGNCFVNYGSPSYAANGLTDGNGFGDFSYAVPTGYYALNTQNLNAQG